MTGTSGAVVQDKALFVSLALQRIVFVLSQPGSGL